MENSNQVSFFNLWEENCLQVRMNTKPFWRTCMSNCLAFRADLGLSTVAKAGRFQQPRVDQYRSPKWGYTWNNQARHFLLATWNSFMLSLLVENPIINFLILPPVTLGSTGTTRPSDWNSGAILEWLKITWVFSVICSCPRRLKVSLIEDRSQLFSEY